MISLKVRTLSGDGPPEGRGTAFIAITHEITHANTIINRIEYVAIVAEKKELKPVLFKKIASECHFLCVKWTKEGIN